METNITVLSFIIMASMDKDKDFRDSYKWTKINLGLVGAWPNENTSIIKKCQVIINAILMITCVYIPRFVALYFFRKNLNGLVYSASTNLMFIISVFKIAVILYYQDVFVKMFNEISNDWNRSVAAGYYHIIKKYANISRNMSFSTFLMVWSGCTVATVAQKYSNMEIDKKNTPDPRLTIDLVWVSYVPYNVHTSRTIFIIHWILQWYASVIGAIMYGAFDSFCVFLMFHLIGQLKVLQEIIHNINEKKKISENIITKLKYVVKRHQELIRFATILEKCFNKILLIQLISSCLNFTAQGYLLLGGLVKGEMTLSQQIMTILYGLYSLSHFFFLCYSGEVLEQASINIGYAAYETQWYNFKKNEKFLIMFIIQNTLEPLKITTFKYSSLSYYLFFTVLKTSFSYLSVLLAVKYQ
ncbi:odorant receptor 13a-like [Aphidius gifuensis]|uniref:Odorant receptor n=1 Tax=Aphidius gifuensis TaxID=684658 RepID=A0A3S9LWA8_APHGI|nr:odorant receptor 13a-like [Aphidius gifuensis]AZQ24909.1 odorant receptor [Aphidius gifuensis]